MGGIGKTTLAKKAYDYPRVRSRFDVHAWVTVSREFGMRRLLLSLVRCIPGMTDKFLEKTEDQLAVSLYRKLKDRRYLIVIDDIWSTKVWDDVTRCFPDDDNGSRIILTSRLKDVAAYADPDSPLHEMGTLSLDDSWKLLSIKVFGAYDLCPSELEDIGKQIAEKCGGLPLAILVVAGHLSRIARRRESWIIVAKTVSSVVANDPDKCLGVLGMSYGYLPNHLKPCFLSIGAFPEDFEIKAGTLIQVWAAEGFLKVERLKSLEKVAEECLEDLVSRNLIMIRKRRFNGEIRSCRVHDLLRDLSLREAQKEKFLHVTSTRYVSNFLAQRNEGRGFSFLSNISLNDSSELSSHVGRSMFFWGELLISAQPQRQFSLFASFKLIRVLAIFSHLFPSFPAEITQLIHLRYLWIRSNGGLPASMSRLFNLQTLIFQQPELYYMYKTLMLPREIWSMTQLRRLRLLSGNYLSKPKRSGKTDEGAASDVVELSNLEELSHLCFASCTEEVFSYLPNIRKLSILDAASDDASEYLKNLVHLEKLETLKCVCYGQKRLSLSNWCGSLTSIKRLILSGCLLLSEDMASLAALPNLEVLKLRDNEFEGRAWTVSDEDEFSQLKFLVVAEPRLVNWEAGSVNFPNLQKLVFRKCIHLEEIPMDIGEICPLEVIELIGCSSSAQNSAKELQEEQESMGNSCLEVRVYEHASQNTNGRRTENQSAPQPIQADPLDEYVFHIVFRAAFTTLSNSVAAQNKWLTAVQANLVANTAAARIQDFTRMNPLLFSGSKSEEDPQEFLDQWKVDRGTNAEPIEWEEFDTVFQDRFFPLELREAKVLEFINLRQGSMSVKEYSLMFTQLARLQLPVPPVGNAQTDSMHFSPDKIRKFLLMWSLVCVHHLMRVKDSSSDISSLESVPVVNEFSDVFPEDLLEVLLKRKIDFEIDLLPNTQPISISSYRMAPAELKKLNE
ncbi:hypothetical protein BC332_02368 [Capsicum chinense]|nr:hypothetical protein BC332_02368 [Capsicum chinense]